MTPRVVLLSAACMSFGAVSIALISQHVFAMPPCAWCVLQRIVLNLIGLVCLIGAVSRGDGKVIAGIGAIFALLGASAAIFQLTVASNLASCDRTLADRVVTGSGLDEMLPEVFGVYAGCADAKVSVLGLEYAVWALALFICLFTLLGRYAAFGKRSV